MIVARMVDAVRWLRIRLVEGLEWPLMQTLPPQVRQEVPYFGQWESVAHIADYSHDCQLAMNDPLWRQSGAQSEAEYAQWAPHICGMACFKMILAASQGKIVPTVTLARQCEAVAGYRQPLSEHVGLYYGSFKRLVEERYGGKVRIPRPLTLYRIKKALKEGQYVMASVAVSIDLAPAPPTGAGHLVVITGYNDQDAVIYFHNPGGRSQSRQASTAMSYDQFRRYFNYKGVIVGFKG